MFNTIIFRNNYIVADDQVKKNYSGWEWINESKEGRPKWGYVSNTVRVHKHFSLLPFHFIAHPRSRWDP